jgi:hypothetical protein
MSAGPQTVSSAICRNMCGGRATKGYFYININYIFKGTVSQIFEGLENHIGTFGCEQMA